jgi:hypothetical protein
MGDEMKTDDGGPAFARPHSLTYMNESIDSQDGMTIRQFYAGLAMQGIMASCKVGYNDFVVVAQARKLADALIEELKK